ncbi:MAG: hypothetical protein JZD41_05635, partial [Thermoproteus sp.]|nr:hypothetical protein [Thermoproteus sp.]
PGEEVLVVGPEPLEDVPVGLLQLGRHLGLGRGDLVPEPLLDGAPSRLYLGRRIAPRSLQLLQDLPAASRQSSASDKASPLSAFLLAAACGPRAYGCGGGPK